MTCRTFLLIISYFIGHSIGIACPNVRLAEVCMCIEATGEPYRYRLFCNGAVDGMTVANATALAREDNIAENVTELHFNGPLDPSVLRRDTFLNFTSLERLDISSSQLNYIEPYTFNSLPLLTSLTLSKNYDLTWLSGDPFIGVTSLITLVLDESAIQYLREDLEPFFSTVFKISLDKLPLHCDCHLQWLYNFITVYTDIVKEATCNGDDQTPLNEATSFDECPDICELGYHPCHPNATCTEVTINNITQTSCSCNENFTVNGINCELIPCDCPADKMMCIEPWLPCVCAEGYTLTNNRDSCYQIVSDIFLNLTTECSGDNPASTIAICTEKILLATTHNLTLPGDINQVILLLESMIDRLIYDNDQVPSDDTTQNLVEVASQLLNESNLDLWLNDNLTDSTSAVVEIFSAMNDLGIVLLDRTNITNITTDNIALVVVRPDCESEDSVPSFNGYNISSDLLGQPPASGSSSNLFLPMSLFSDIFVNDSVGACSAVGVVSLVYGGIGPLLTLNDDQLLATVGCSEEETQPSEEICSWYGDVPVDCPTEWLVNSVIISATVVNSSEAISTQLSSPVIISLAHEDTSLSSPVCAFIDETQPVQSGDSWLTENCFRDEMASNDVLTVCNCYHLTSFALVMSPSSSPPPDNQPLNIATKVGLSLSIFCLLVTVILLFGLKLKNKFYTLHHVHRQLAIALGLAQLVFLVGVDRSAVPSPDQLCTTWAVLLHYFLLATFLWQLCEGIHIYLLIGKVFYSFEHHQIIYLLIAWGVPLVIVAPTVGLRFCDYGSRNYCWITPDGGALWAFHGPVIAVLLINAMVLIYVVTVIVRLTQRKQEDACLLITLIHASVVLVPILGVTWALGFLVVAGGVYATVVEWLFFVFTTLQGVAIFISHCVINREIRSSFLKAVGCNKMADNQMSIVDASRHISRRDGPNQHLKRMNSKTSGTFSVGGFTTPTAPSRRESDIDNPYYLNDPLGPISEVEESTTKLTT